MHWLLATLIVIGGLLLGSVPTTGRPTEMVLVDQPTGTYALDPIFCDGRHVAVITAVAAIALPDPGFVGMECNIISRVGADVVSVDAVAPAQVYDVAAQDGALRDYIVASSLAGASITLLKMSNGNWTAKRKYGDWTAHDDV